MKPFLLYTHVYALVECGTKPSKHLYAFGLTRDNKPVSVRITGWITVVNVKVRADMRKPPFIVAGKLAEEKTTLTGIIDSLGRMTLAWKGTNTLASNAFTRGSPNPSASIAYICASMTTHAHESAKKAIGAQRIPDCRWAREGEPVSPGLRFSPTQWLCIKGVNTERRIVEMTVEASNLRTPTAEEMPAFIPKALIAILDIETHSSLHERGRFPDRDLPDDIIYCISYVLSKANGGFDKRCIVVCPKDVGRVHVEGVTIVQVEDEQEALVALSEVINDTNPDALITYNGLRYDFGYIAARSVLYDGFPTIGRVQSTPNETFVVNKWIGAGGKYNEYRYPRAFGKVILDAYITAKATLKVDEIGQNRKGINGGSRSHKLDDVGEYLCNEKKLSVSYKEQFATYARIVNGDTSAIPALNKVVEYCVQDSVLCAKVLNALKIWVEARETAAITYRDMTDVFTTGMMRKYKEQLVRMTRREGFYLMPTERTAGFRLKGGHVEKPMKGFIEDVCVLDFAGMYPSIMMAYNICPSACQSSLRDIDPRYHSAFDKVKMVKQVGLTDLPADYDISETFNINLFKQKTAGYEYNRAYVVKAQ